MEFVAARGRFREDSVTLYLLRPLQFAINCAAQQSKLAVRRTSSSRTRTSGHLQTMIILCNVDQKLCLRHGIDAPSSTVKIEINPTRLTENQRNFLADELYEGLRFSKDHKLALCPPTYSGLIVAINYGIERKAKLKNSYDSDTAEIKQTWESSIKAAIEESKKQREEELNREPTQQEIDQAITF